MSRGHFGHLFKEGLLYNIAILLYIIHKLNIIIIVYYDINYNFFVI